MASHFKFYFYYMNSPKHTLVLGASDNPARYSYLAVNRLRNAGRKKNNGWTSTPSPFT
jgi:predicted CoA-binding protein